MRWRPIRSKYLSELERLKTQDPFELLEISGDASLAEIRAAYREKVKTYHPDGADTFMKSYNQEVTKLLNAAYKTLTEKNDQNG